MNNFYPLIEQVNSIVAIRSLLEKVIQYALNHRDHVYIVLSDGRLVLCNNLGEGSIKSLVKGRKNQLFAQLFAGADAGEVILELIETVKLPGLDTIGYNEYLLTHIPNEPVLATADQNKYTSWSPEELETCAIVRPMNQAN